MSLAGGKTAYCGMEEHTHTDECLGQEGGCSLAEHEYSLACYSNPQADVESQEEWEKTIPVFENEAPRLWREVQIAKSQLGYRESSQNYVVEDGVAYGITRYGSWVGSPYAKWNAQFVCFCLGYSGIDHATFPRASNADAWEEQLRAAYRFVAADDATYKPQPGDIVLLARGDVHSAAVITSVDEATGEFRVAEGDLDDAVREVKLSAGGSARQDVRDAEPNAPPAQSSASSQADRSAESDATSGVGVDDKTKGADKTDLDDKTMAAVGTEKVGGVNASVAEKSAGDAKTRVAVSDDDKDAGSASANTAADKKAAIAAGAASNSDANAADATKGGKTDGKAEEKSNASEKLGAGAGVLSTKAPLQSGTQGTPKAIDALVSKIDDAMRGMSGAQNTRTDGKTDADGKADAEGKTDTDAKTDTDGGASAVAKPAPETSGQGDQKADPSAQGGAEATDDAKKAAQENAASLQDGDDLSKGFAPIVSDVVSSVQEKRSRFKWCRRGPRRPVVLGYGKMPDELRREYDAYVELLAQREADKAKEQEPGAGESADAKEDGIKVVDDGPADDANAGANPDERSDDFSTDKGQTSEASEQQEKAPEVHHFPKVEIPQVLTAAVDGYQITADLDGQAKEGYALKAERMEPSADQLAQMEESLSKELPNGARKQARVDAGDVALFDIAVVDEIGREVVLSGQVRVSVAEPDPNADFIGPMPEKSLEASSAGEVSPAPEVFHFSGAEPGASVESVDVQESDEGFSFTTASFSPFAFVYTVDFEYEGYTYNLEGGGETLLSQLIGSLNLDFAASDVVAVTFSNPELLASEPVRDEHDHIADWKLTSLRPFATTEVLTITLKTGEIVSVVVTDAQHITELSRIIEAATLSVDGVDIPWPALVREGKYYDLRLEFKENEIYQFIDDDTAMTYTLPEGIYIGDEDFERTFTMDVGDGVRLEQEVDTSHEWAPNGSDEDYIYWKITFKRQPYKLTRCVIEDNNPTLYGKREEVDVGNKEAQDFSEIHAYDYRITGTDEFNLSDPGEEFDILWVDGLYPAEGWQISAATNTRTTIRFYQDKESVKPGLVQRDPQKTDEENTITIYLRTKNNENWIKGTMTQYWPRDHTNSVTWIPNAHQVDAEATATPDIRKIEKVGKQVGTVSDPATGVMLPVFRYEIYVTGLSPDDFDVSGNFEITDSFNTNFLKFVEVTNYNSPYPGSVDLVSHKFMMASDDQTEFGVTWWDETFKGFSKSNKWVGPVKVTVSDFGSGGKDGVRFVVKKSDFEDTTRRNGLEPGSDSEYCMRYSLPYYLVVKDANAAQKLAQLAEGQYTEGEFAGITKTADGKVLFGNTATWGSASLESTVDADADFSPMSKTVSYDSNTDTCTYTIIINPQRLRLNDGEIVCVRDTYTNLAVDFLSVAEGISTVPPENKNLVDWSYHNNAGTFFVPDETMVTITYRAQPIGDPGKSVTFSNEVSMLNFEPKSITKTVKLNSESEGSAGDYNVRVFKYADNSMNVPLQGAVFQLRVAVGIA